MLRTLIPHLVLGALSGLTGLACAPQQKCQTIADDQQGSLSVPLPRSGTAVIRVDSRFNADEAARIGRAVDEWNRVSQSKWNRVIWVLQSGAPSSSQASALTSSSGELAQFVDCHRSGQMESGSFVIRRVDKSSDWTQVLGLPADALGLTARCLSGSDLVGQVVLVNGERTPADQLASVVLHELGHAAGLDHSCQPGNGSADFAGCEKISDSHAYRKAVMYPSMWTLVRGSQVVASERKESLQANDWERAQCHYRAQ